MGRKLEWQAEALQYARIFIGNLRSTFPNMQMVRVKVKREQSGFIIKRDWFTIEVTLRIAYHLFRAQEKAPSLRAAFDKALDEIEEQLQRLAIEEASTLRIAFSKDLGKIERQIRQPAILASASQIAMLGLEFRDIGIISVEAKNNQVNVLYQREV